MAVPFIDFKRHHAAVAEVVEPAIQRVLASGWYVLGAEVEAFEGELAEYLGCAYCVGVASGTDAITLGLMAAGVEPGDEVITTTMTAYPTITGIERAGAVPVVVDIDPQTGLLDCDKVEAAIGEKTRVILPVHLYGQCCDMGRLQEVADRHDLVIVEDCAQAIGATYGGQTAGTMGLAGAFSFYPTKNLGCFGDGGAVATNSEAMYKQLKSLRNYGQSDRYNHDIPGLNSRLDELQAAILRAKLPLLKGWTARRREIASMYVSRLNDGVVPLVEMEYGEGVYHLFVVRSGDRDGLMAHLTSEGVGSLIHYPTLVCGQKAFGGRVGALSVLADEVTVFSSQIVSLPLYPELTDAEVNEVIARVNDFGKTSNCGVAR